MIRHIALFRWADDVPPETKAEIFAGLDRLATLECVADYRHGPDLELNEGNFDYAVSADFRNEDDYRSYATEAGHVQLINDLIKPSIAARAAIQFALD